MTRPALLLILALACIAGLWALANADDPDPFECKESLDDIS